MFRSFATTVIKATKPHVTKFMSSPSTQKKTAMGMFGIYGFTCGANTDQLHTKPMSNMFAGSIGAIIFSCGGFIVLECLPFSILPIVAPSLGCATLHKIYTDFSKNKEYELEAMQKKEYELEAMQKKEYELEAMQKKEYELEAIQKKKE